VRAQEAHAFFCDLCELQEGDHLEAARVGGQLWLIPVLWVWDMLWVLRNRNLPSAIYSHVSLLILKFHTSLLAPAATLFKYLSRYYAATTAIYVHRRRHRAFFVQVSSLFATRQPKFDSLSL
jgi:hypothetical protein